MERKSPRSSPAPIVSSLSLEELLDGFWRACPIAAAELVRRFEPELFLYAGRLLAGHPMLTTTAQDLVQDTWLRLIRSLLRGCEFVDEAHFVALLHRIAVGLVSEHCRARHAAKRSCHAEPLDVSRHDQASNEPNPAEAAAVADELHRVRNALGPRRAALVDALRNGLSIAEASAQLGIAERTARRWIEELRRMFAPNFDDQCVQALVSQTYG